MIKPALIAIVATMVACKQSAAPAAAGPSGSGSTAIPVPTHDAPAAPAPSGKPLRDAISEAAAGKPVLLALGAKGELVARTTDGSYTAVLLPGPYGDALHDSTLDLIWLRRDAGLDVLDLRMPGPPLGKTLATAPDKVLEALGEHFSEAPHWDMTSAVVVNLETLCSRASGVVLDWSKGGIGTRPSTQSVKIVDKSWFAEHEHRSRRQTPPGFTKKAPKRHKVPTATGTCRIDAKEELGRDECGHGLYFGASRYELVVVSANSEKCPAKQCRLYDEASKKYIAVPGVAADDPEDHTCGPFLFDAAGASYLVHDKVCSVQMCIGCGSSPAAQT